MKKYLPNIFEYNDFRKYLEEYQKSRYSYDKNFTKSNFSKMMMLPNTRSFFNDVLRGKKVTTTFIERFISAMELAKEEAQFFRVLVKFNQAENVNERELYFDQLISLNRTPKQVLDRSVYTYYKYWYNSVIRASLEIFDFNGTNFSVLQKRIFPPVTIKQVKDSITLLIKLGLIEKNDKGFYKPTQRAITTSDYVRDELIKQYQLQCLEVAKKAILSNGLQKQAISTNILSISENGLKRIEKKVHTFRNEIRSLVHKDEDKAETIYQLDILLFPHLP